MTVFSNRIMFGEVPFFSPANLPCTGICWLRMTWKILEKEYVEIISSNIINTPLESRYDIFFQK